MVLLQGGGSSSAAAKVKGVAICSILLNLTCQILSIILIGGLLKNFTENIKKFAEESEVHDIKFPDSSEMMMNHLPEQLMDFVVAMALPVAGFFGASRMHKRLIMFFFACSFCCACLHICNCVIFAGIVTFTGPLGDQLLDEFQRCNMYTRCNVWDIQFKQHNSTTDCILASVWPQYERQFPGYGHPASPAKCGTLAYSSLICHKINVSNSTTSTITTTLNSSSSIPMVSSFESDSIWQKPDAEIRRLLSKPVSAFNQDWAHSLSLAINGRPRRLRQKPVPVMPRDPLQACEVDIKHAKTFSRLLDLVESELPTIRIISVISMLISFFTACVNCAGGFFGKELHEECWAVQPTPSRRVGSLVAPVAPETVISLEERR